MRSELCFLVAEPVHRALLAQIEAACFSDCWNEAQLRSHIDSPVCRAELICLGEQPIGELLWQEIAPEWELYRIALLPEYRGRGYGRAAMEHLTEAAAERGCDLGYLEVRASNSAAIALYTACGWQQTGLRRGYYHCPAEDGVIMTKKG